MLLNDEMCYHPYAPHPKSSINRLVQVEICWQSLAPLSMRWYGRSHLVYQTHKQLEHAAVSLQSLHKTCPPILAGHLGFGDRVLALSCPPQDGASFFNNDMRKQDLLTCSSIGTSLPFFPLSKPTWNRLRTCEVLLDCQ
jgi:hypothetical protein